MENPQRLMEDAEMLADVKAYDDAKARIESGEDEPSHWKLPSTSCA